MIQPRAAVESDEDAFGEFLSGMPDVTTASRQLSVPSTVTLSAADTSSDVPDDCVTTGVKQNQTGENFSH